MSRSEALFERAKKTIPGGVNSPVRAFKAVGGTPRFMERADGAYLFDADGRRYIDYVLSWGPMIMGHNHPRVRDAVVEAAQGGLSFGCPTEIEIELAETISRLVPSMALVRMTSSGTEATMSAIRLARGFTGRDKIIKFEGCYHGHSDSLLVKAGSGVLTLGLPNSPGVPAALAEKTLTVPYNDFQSTEELFATYGDQIACVIVEPIAGNMGCILPDPDFLRGLKSLTEQFGSVLIFDEVMSGFRVAPGGAQEIYGITPDLTTLGKIVGGGLPVGAFGGRRDIMSQIAPLGPIYQAGTLSGNPLAMSAGLTTLNHLTPEVYATITKATDKLISGLVEGASKNGIAVCENHVCGMFGFFFGIEKAENYQDVAASNIAMFNDFFHIMLNKGIYLAPSAFEAGFISAEHSDEIINLTLEDADGAFAQIADKHA